MKKLFQIINLLGLILIYGIILFLSEWLIKSDEAFVPPCVVKGI